MSVSSIPSASVYTDLKGLDQLKHTVKSDSIDDLRIAAQQFEAVFIQQMLKTMRDASLAEGMFDSNEGDYYMELLDKQLSLNMSAGRGIGLADIIVQQLSRSLDLKEGASSENKDEPENSAVLQLQNITAGQGILHGATTSAPIKRQSYQASEDNKPVERLTVGDGSTANNTTNSTTMQQSTGLLNAENTQKITDPETFIKTLWPLASSAAKQIDVAPHVLIAQAALETGWGQYVGKDQKGNSSHNLFNIKGGANWQGETITVATTEFKNGEAVKEYAAFRAYDSYNESFADYVALVKSNPRYKQALQNSTDPQGYISALHKAGYATDPEYSEKIMDIANGQTMIHAMETIKALKI